MHINQQINWTARARKRSRLDHKFLYRLIDILLYAECGAAEHALISLLTADIEDVVGIKTW